ncbi:MAG: hypothetical protein ACLUAR_04935 [Pilosibacter sp.]
MISEIAMFWRETPYEYSYPRIVMFYTRRSEKILRIKESWFGRRRAKAGAGGHKASASRLGPGKKISSNFCGWHRSNYAALVQSQITFLLDEPLCSLVDIGLRVEIENLRRRCAGDWAYGIYVTRDPAGVFHGGSRRDRE